MRDFGWMQRMAEASASRARIVAGNYSIHSVVNLKRSLVSNLLRSSVLNFYLIFESTRRTAIRTCPPISMSTRGYCWIA